MTSLTGCTGGGWTLVMKTDGNKVCKNFKKNEYLNRFIDMYSCIKFSFLLLVHDRIRTDNGACACKVTSFSVFTTKPIPNIKARHSCKKVKTIVDVIRDKYH